MPFSVCMLILILQLQPDYTTLAAPTCTFTILIVSTVLPSVLYCTAVSACHTMPLVVRFNWQNRFGIPSNYKALHPTFDMMLPNDMMFPKEDTHTACLLDCYLRKQREVRIP